MVRVSAAGELLEDDEDDPPPPPLAGHIPIHVEPGRTVEGVFREDQLREAAIDLDQITRGNVNPFAAMLTPNRTADSFQPVTAYDPVTETGGSPDGPAVPVAAFRQQAGAGERPRTRRSRAPSGGTALPWRGRPAGLPR